VPKKLYKNINVIFGLAFFRCSMIIVPSEIFYLQIVVVTNILVLEAPSHLFVGIMSKWVGLVWASYSANRRHLNSRLGLLFAQFLG